MLKIIININDMKQLVNQCSLEMITNICFARCCRYSSYGLGHALIMPIGSEIEYFKNASIGTGAEYDENLGIMKLKTKLCPAQDCKTHLCKLHYTGNKPYGCGIMPLIMKKDKLKVRGFIRNYFCQKHNFPNIQKVPFYIGFRQSLVAVFGEEETNRIAQEIENGKEEIIGNISEKNHYRMTQVRKIIAKAAVGEKE